MGNFHQVVVHNISQMIGGKFIGTLIKDLVIQNAAVDTYLSTDKIVNQDVSSGFNQEADNILFAIGNEFVNFFFCQRQRIAHLHTCAGIILEVLNLSTFGIQFFRCVKGDVSLAIV